MNRVKRITVGSLALVIFLGLIAIFAGRLSRTSTNSDEPFLDSLGTELSAEKLPLTFSASTFDDGVVWQPGDGSPLVRRHSYYFVNSSDKPVVITKVETSCGCEEVIHPRDPIGAKQKGEISISFSLEGREGHFKSGILLFFNNKKTLRVYLSYSCFIVGRATVAPAVLDFGEIPAGQRREQHLAFRIPLALTEKQARFVSCQGQTGAFQYQVGRIQTASENIANASPRPLALSRGAITVSFHSDKLGRDLEDEVAVRFHNRDPLKVRIKARIVHPSFVVRPSIVNLGVFGSGDAVTRRISVISTSGAPPPVRSIVVPAGSPLKAWLQRNSEDTREVFVCVEVKGTPAEPLKGTLVLKVDHPSFTNYEIPFVGLPRR